MPVPKTSMYKNDFTATGENQIGISRQIASMKPKAEAHAVHKLADKDFRLSVAGPNPRHPFASR